MEAALLAKNHCTRAENFTNALAMDTPPPKWCAIGQWYSGEMRLSRPVIISWARVSKLFPVAET